MIPNAKLFKVPNDKVNVDVEEYTERIIESEIDKEVQGCVS